MARAHLKIIGTYKALALATFYKADYSVSREEGEEERNRIRGRGKVSPVSPFRTDESCRNSMYARPILRWKTLYPRRNKVG